MPTTPAPLLNLPRTSLLSTDNPGLRQVLLQVQGCLLSTEEQRRQTWDQAIETFPHLLCVSDKQYPDTLLCNPNPGLALGHAADSLRHMGARYWERLLHPDDQELYQRLCNIHHILLPGQSIEGYLRWRNQAGHWHHFIVRMQSFACTPEQTASGLVTIAKDVTERIELLERLSKAEHRYRLLTENANDIIFTTTPGLEPDYISPAVANTLGYTAEQLLHQKLDNLASNPAQLQSLYLSLARIRLSLERPKRIEQLRQKAHQPRIFHLDCHHADGSRIPLEIRLTLTWDRQGKFQGLLGIARNISQQRNTEKALRMAATVFSHSTAAILVCDPAGYIVQVNEAFTRITGYPGSEVLDQLPNLLLADRTQTSQQRYILDQMHANGSWEGEVWLRRLDGSHFPSWLGITAIQDDEGDLVSYVGFFNDMSERKASEQRIHRLAYYDALTQLPNRTLFQDRLHTALQHAKHHKQWVAMMFLDLDRFKPINDSLGHAAGDRMLKEVAARLTSCISVDDSVARMGGDEFTLLLRARSTRESALNNAIRMAEQILHSLAQPFILEGREFFVTASIGIALGPQDGDEPSQLMKNADTAMYHAKEMGKNNFQFYQAEMNASALERLELESALRHALLQDEFELYYQPQYSSDTCELTGIEALLRWLRPNHGMVPPQRFIPVLEELGLIVQVGDWVLREACSQLQRWRDDGLTIPKVSVNLSARQFIDGQLGNRIARVLKDTGLPPACLELELTESTLMRDVRSAMQTLNRLKRLGLYIAVDDFGTGYSSLNYLKQFPIDVLKIDRSFVDGLPHGEQDAQIARAIIAMAHSLNLSVIAEGLETIEQLEFLRLHGCDEVQGYLLGYPMPAEILHMHLASASSAPVAQNEPGSPDA